MKILWISLILLSIAYAESIDCPKYFTNSEIAKENEVCALENFGTVNLIKCADKLVCRPFVYQGEATCMKKRSLVAGQPCEDKSDCASDNCTEKFCGGIASGNNCNSTSQCDKNLYCSPEKKCEKAGEKCNDDGSGCLNYQVCFKNRACIALASLENGALSDFPAACKTYYINEEGKCSNGTALKTGKVYTCPNDNSCKYNVDGTEVTMPCMCAKKNGAEKYCLPGIKDMNRTQVIFCLSL